MRMGYAKACTGGSGNFAPEAISKAHTPAKSAEKVIESEAMRQHNRSGHREQAHEWHVIASIRVRRRSVVVVVPQKPRPQ